MKPAGLLLFIPAGFVAVLSAEEAPGLASRETKARIREGLPTYQPPPPKPDDKTTDSAAGVATPDVLVLPKMTVTEKRLPSDAADHLMSKRDFNRKMENLYLDSVAEDGPLNVLLNSTALPILNKITIPLPPRKIKDGRALARSVEIERGRAIYRAKEIERLEYVTEVRGQLDREAAVKFNQEIDNTVTTRPAGGK